MVLLQKEIIPLSVRGTQEKERIGKMIPKLDPGLRDECLRLRDIFVQHGLVKQAAEIGVALKQAEEDSIREHRMGKKRMDRTFEAMRNIAAAMSSLPQNAVNSDLCSAIERIHPDFEIVAASKDDAPSFLKKLASDVEMGIWQLAVESTAGEMKSAISSKARTIIGELPGIE